MIIYVDKKGNAYHITSEEVYQNSNEQTDFRIVGDFDPLANFKCSFKLPSGVITPPKDMQYELFSEQNSWKLPITSDLTEDYGIMKFQFRGDLNGKTVATGRGVINIIRSEL